MICLQNEQDAAAVARAPPTSTPIKLRKQFSKLNLLRYMNRARCLAALGNHQEAAQDLGIIIGMYDNIEATERLDKLSTASLLKY